VVSFRSDPDRWARYFRVQRMISQLERVEREAAEKRRQETEIADESSYAPARHSKKSARRPTSASATLKVLVFGSGSGPIAVDPTPLLPVGRGTDGLKSSRSADGRLNVVDGKAPPPPTPPPAIIRTHSCDYSTAAARTLLPADEPQLKRSVRSSATLQVHRV